jgi:signal transduction histidine kinase
MLASLDGAGGMQSAALARLQEELEQLAQTAGASERKLRDLCAGLYPALLESLGLLAALESLAEELTASGHIQITVHWDPLVEELSALLAADIRLHIYRIAQEALRNAARHAQAQQAALHIAMVQSPRRATNADARSVRRSLVFTISDDGAGLRFPLDYVELLRGGHLGLASMRERAEHIGAELAIAAGPGGGTRIQLVMPIPAERATGQIPDDRPYRQLDERARSLQMALAGPTPRRDTQPGEPALTSPTAPRN